MNKSHKVYAYKCEIDNEILNNFIKAFNIEIIVIECLDSVEDKESSIIIVSNDIDGINLSYKGYYVVNVNSINIIPKRLGLVHS